MQLKSVLGAIILILIVPLVQATTLFESNWSTATGNSSTALTDDGIWGEHACNISTTPLYVVDGATVGWTLTPNALRIMDTGASACGTLAEEPGLPVSTSHWGRFYFRDDETTGVNNHFATYHMGRTWPIQLAHWNRQGTPTGTRSFIRTYYHSSGVPTADNRPTGGENLVGLTSWAPPVLPRSAWYRYEWHMEYVTATTYRIWPRIYTLQGSLLYDADDYQQNGYQEGSWANYNDRSDWTLASYYAADHTFGFTDVNLARNIGFGQEGTAGYPVGSGQYFYTAALKYDDGGWIGAIDTTPPTATITAPTAAQLFPADTTQVTLSVTTNESATCRWSTGDQAYGSMPSGQTLAGGGTTSHTTTITGLGPGSFTQYVRCQDTALNNMTTSVQARFSIKSANSLLFESNWSTAVGSDSLALSDGGKWDVSLCPELRAEVLSVVPASTVNFTLSTNVLRMTSAGSRCGRALVDNIVPASTTHWARFYWRNDETQNFHGHPTSYPTGVGGENIQIVPWNRLGQVNGHIIGTYNYGPGVAGVGPSLLQNGVWYRYEWQIEYLNATTLRLWPRVYDMNGVLLYNASNYVTALWPFMNTLQSYYDGGGFFTIDNPEWAREFSLGNEGPAVEANNGQHWYFANVAFSTQGWIGGNRPEELPIGTRIGDLNRDGVVNLQDVILIIQNFKRRQSYDEGADINNDGTVNIFDMVLLGRNWG